MTRIKLILNVFMIFLDFQIKPEYFPSKTFYFVFRPFSYLDCKKIIVLTKCVTFLRASHNFQIGLNCGFTLSLSNLPPTLISDRFKTFSWDITWLLTTI